MKRSLLAAAVALVLGSVGCLAVLLYVKGADSRALAGKKAVQVLLATKRIPAGTTGARIRSGDYIEVVTMPHASVPSDAMSKLDEALDKLAVNSDIQPRQLLLRGSFDEPTRTTGGLSMPEGKLAVSVQMAGPQQVAGFVRPGSKISIFDTFSTSAGTNVPTGEKLSFGKGTNQVTRILLPRVEVIAIGSPGAGAMTSSGRRSGATDGTGDDEEEAGQNPVGESLLITVAVNQDEAERLVHAVQTGTLYFALLDESSDVRPGPGVTNDNLFP